MSTGNSCKQKNQIKTILLYQHDYKNRHLFQRLKQILAIPFFHYPKEKQLMLDQFMKIAHTNNDDEQIYSLLRTYYQDTIVPRMQISESSNGRAESRVSDLVDLIYKYKPDYKYTKPRILDIGCNTGSNSEALGQHMNLVVDGCDVLISHNQKKSSDHFRFTLLDEDQKELPYISRSFDIVISLMTLHHITNVENTLSEVKRILKPGGLFIIREHDCCFPLLSVVIDIQHALYERVWSNPAEQESFCDRYYAQYRTRKEWTHLIEQHGLKCCIPDSDYRAPMLHAKTKYGSTEPFIANPFAHYYNVYTSNNK